MKPVYGVTLPDLMKLRIKDKIFVNGSIALAKTIAKRVENKTASGTNLFDDAHQSFLQVGLDSKQATEAAWDLMGILSTGGGNTADRVYEFEGYQDQMAVASRFITVGSAVLDSLSMASGSPYTFPKEIKTTCDFGKPYHFWMSAYLARRVGREIKSPEGALYATWLTHIGYQMRSTTVGRDPRRVFRVDPYDTGNHKMRMDVSFAAAGALFGAADASGRAGYTLNVDEALRSVLQGTEPQERLSQSEAESQWSGTGAEGYFRWKKIIACDRALDFLSKSAGF